MSQPASSKMRTNVRAATEHRVVVGVGQLERDFPPSPAGRCPASPLLPLLPSFSTSFTLCDLARAAPRRRAAAIVAPRTFFGLLAAWPSLGASAFRAASAPRRQDRVPLQVSVARREGHRARPAIARRTSISSASCPCSHDLSRTVSAHRGRARMASRRWTHVDQDIADADHRLAWRDPYRRSVAPLSRISSASSATFAGSSGRKRWSGTAMPPRPSVFRTGPCSVTGFVTDGFVTGCVSRNNARRRRCRSASVIATSPIGGLPMMRSHSVTTSICHDIMGGSIVTRGSVTKYWWA